MSLYYLGNYRYPGQLTQMQQLEERGVCIFCPEHLTAGESAAKVVYRGAQWTVVHNAYPYVGTRLHYLLVPNLHVTDLLDLPGEALHDFWVALAWVRQHHGLTFYSLLARNGDCEFTGATVRHVHVHLLQGEVEDPQHVPVRVKLSSRPPR